MSIALVGEPYAAPAATVHRYLSICTLLYWPDPPVSAPAVAPISGRTVILAVENGRSRPCAGAAKAATTPSARTATTGDRTCISAPSVHHLWQTPLPASPGARDRISSRALIPSMPAQTFCELWRNRQRAA